MAEDPTTGSTSGPDVDRPDGDRATERGPDAGRPTDRGPLPFSQLVGRIVLGAIAVLFVIFAVFNRQPVDFSWVFGETQVVKEGGEYVSGGVPLIVLLITSFVLGGLLSAGLLWRRRRVRRSRRDGGPDGDPDV